MTNASDYALLQSFFERAGATSIVSDGLQNADVNGNFVVNETDAQIIYDYISRTGAGEMDSYQEQQQEWTEKYSNDLQTSAVISGVYGENANWTYDGRTATYTISGTGKLEYADPPMLTTYGLEMRQQIQKGIVESGITEVPDNTFYLCQNMTSVEIADTVTSIGKNAFNVCSSLESITILNPNCDLGDENTIPYGAKIYGLANSTAEQYAKKYNRWFVSVDGEAMGTCGNDVSWKLNIDEGLLTISGTGAMWDYPSMQTVPWYPYDEYVKKVVIEEGITNVGTYTLYNLTNLTSVSLPSTLEKIGASAFVNCIRLGTVVIPDNVTEIGSYAFNRCTLLKTIKFSKNLKTIGNSAFQQCSYMSTVELPESLEILGRNAFAYCECLQSVKIPSGSIGESAFLQCRYLASVTLGNGVTAINSRVFEGCNSLKSISIPASVTEFSGHDAFNDCSQLTAINVAEDNPEYTSVDGVLYTKDETRLISCPKTKKEIFIPDTVTSIGGTAFWRCQNLSSVVFGKNVQDIEAYAFAECPSIRKVELPESVSHIDVCAFASNDGMISIRIPNPDCVIEDDENTISDKAVIYGYKDSTAESYAKQYNRTFISLAQQPQQTTAPATTTTITTTAKATTSTTKATVTTTKATATTTKATTPATSTTKATATTTTSTATATNATTTTTTTTTTKPTIPTTPTTPVYNQFIDGISNWKFGNFRSIFGDDYFINAHYSNLLMKGLSRTENENMNQLLAMDFEGSCYGMACTSILYCYGILRPSDYQKNANFLSDISSPPTDEIKSLINYYFALQKTDAISQRVTNALCNMSEEDKIKLLLEQLSDGSPTLLTFFKGAGGGHALVAYDVEYGTFVKDKKAYNVKIVTYDCNVINYADNCCMYVNTSDYSWRIPCFATANSESNGKIGFTTDDLDLINYHGYIDGTELKHDETFIPIMSSPSITSDFSLRRINLNGDSWSINSGDDDDIKMFSSFMGEDAEPDMNFAISGTKKGCIMQFDENENANMSMRYPNDLIQMNFANAKEVVFDPSGYTEASGAKSKYEIDFVSNDGYAPTDWYKMNVSGTASTVIFHKAENGYILKSDSLQNVKLSATSDNASPTLSFSTDAPEVLIYEINENRIGVSIDKDGDGTYETPVQPADYAIGDVDGSGVVDIVDVLALNKYLLGVGDVSDAGRTAADVDKNKKVEDSDAMNILKYVVKLIPNFESLSS